MTWVLAFNAFFYASKFLMKRDLFNNELLFRSAVFYLESLIRSKLEVSVRLSFYQRKDLFRYVVIEWATGVLLIAARVFAAGYYALE